MAYNKDLEKYVSRRAMRNIMKNDRQIPITLNDRTAYQINGINGNTTGAFGETIEIDETTYFILDHPILGKLDVSYNPLV